MRERFSFAVHQNYWVFGFSIEPGGYIFIHGIWFTALVHLGRAA